FAMALAQYKQQGFFDETFDHTGAPRPGCEALVGRLQALSDEELNRYQTSADAAMFQMGITFQVYGDGQASERIFPFDILPRLIRFEEWRHVEAGLRQRIRALNLFLDDVYNDQRILEAGMVPRKLIESASCFRAQ